MAEQLQPADPEAIRTALLRVRSLWSEHRPDRAIEAPGFAILTPSTAESRQEIEESPTKPAAIRAFGDLIRLSPLSLPCQEYLLDQAEMFYVYGLRTDIVLTQLNITFSAEDLGTFDPAKAYHNERAYLEHAISVTDTQDEPDLRQEDLTKLREWIRVFEERYHDNSFSYFK